MEGLKVVEVGVYALGPAAGAVLADWGADVVKIEHPLHGDPIRGLAAWGVQPDLGGVTFMYEVLNRGKRSVGLNLRDADGRAILHALVRDADVFITNVLPAARRRFEIEPEQLWDINPRLIYGRGTAYGPRGELAESGGYDSVIFWGRTGMANAVTPPGASGAVMMPSPAYGDIQAGMNLAGGIAAALRSRDRSGRGVLVDTSLLGTGTWAMQASLAGTDVLGKNEMPRFSHEDAPNPLTNSYRTADDRYLLFAMLRSEKYWEDLCTVIGRPDLLTDERFRTFEDRTRNHVECIRELAAVFATRDLASWEIALADQDGPWDVVRQVRELATDPQAVANGYVQQVDYGGGRDLTMAGSPVQFDGSPAQLGMAPELGANTEQVLLELGTTWAEMAVLKDRGVIS
jgi:crotonobetainyl-CoA:carnitine CoA-transferase CaiB-like acyl-CoA transferase